MFERVKKFFGKSSEQKEFESKVLTDRASLPIRMTIGTEEERIPYAPFSIRLLYDIAYYSDLLSVIITTLRNEIFRRDLVVMKNFERKCPECKTTFKTVEEICPKCKVPTVEPKLENKVKLEQLIDQFWAVNRNGEDLIDVLKQLEDDLNIVDDAYLLARKEYYFMPTADGRRKIVGSQVKEWIRVSPEVVKIIANRAGEPGMKDDGTSIRFCPAHRETLIIDDRITACPTCKNETLFYAYFKCTGAKGNTLYYSGDEICHVSKYHPTPTYGFSPINSCWMKVMSLFYQDDFVKNYYMRSRPPKGLLVINSANPDSVEKAWRKMLDLFILNPHVIPPLVVHEPNGKQVAQFIDFMHKLDEMQFTEVRQEFRRAVGAIYGVMPLFIGETLRGGVTNEGLQFAVTNRAVEMGQQVYNGKIFPFISQQLGIDDWTIQLVTPETRDELTELQVQYAKIRNAQALMALGFEVIMDKTGEFVVTGRKLPEPAPNNLVPADDSVPKMEAEKLKLPRIQPQRFAGEPTHIHGFAGMSGAPQDVWREDRMQELADVICKELKIPRIQTRGFLRLLWNTIFRRAFAGLSEYVSTQIKNFIINHIIERGRPEDTIKKISEISGLSEGEAERIFRTETSAIYAKTTELAYRQTDPSGYEYKYKWVGPDDARTTECCRRIKERTKNGVSLEELKHIVEEEAFRFDPRFEVRDFVPHYNCRHTFVRID